MIGWIVAGVLLFLLLCVSIAYEQERKACAWWHARAVRLEREGREMVKQAQLVSATAKQISSEMTRGRAEFLRTVKPLGAGLN